MRIVTLTPGDVVRRLAERARDPVLNRRSAETGRRRQGQRSNRVPTELARYDAFVGSLRNRGTGRPAKRVEPARVWF